MTKRILGLVLTILFAITTCNAQTMKDVVYLKNGSIIRGVINEFVPNESITIWTADKNKFVFKMNEITKIVKENVVEEEEDDDKETDIERIWRPMGYRGFFEFGYSIRLDEFDHTIEALTSHGFQINPRHYVGGGVGVMYFDNEDVAIPVFANYRYSFIRNRVTPYLDLKLGYTPNESYEGLYTSMALGCDVALAPKFNIYTSICYTTLQAERRYYNETLHFLGLKIGLHF